MEAAIKVAERAAGPKRPKIVYAENSFHGKTKGVLSITDVGLYRSDFTQTQKYAVGAVWRSYRYRAGFQSRSSHWRYRS